MAIAASMLEDVEYDAQATAGDVIEFCTVEDDVAVCTLKDGSKVTFSLTAGHIVEVAAEECHEPAGLFINGNVQHIIYALINFLILKMLWPSTR